LLETSDTARRETTSKEFSMKARAQRSDSPVRYRTSGIVVSSLLGGALLLRAALALAPRPAVAAEGGQCSELTPDNRECTATEELAYCLTDVFAEYADCLEEAGVLMKVGCGIEYELKTLKCLGDMARALVK
jgi:hypothetical protein